MNALLRLKSFDHGRNYTVHWSMPPYRGEASHHQGGGLANLNASLRKALENVFSLRQSLDHQARPAPKDPLKERGDFGLFGVVLEGEKAVVTDYFANEHSSFVGPVEDFPDLLASAISFRILPFLRDRFLFEETSWGVVAKINPSWVPPPQPWLFPELKSA